jgi:hypothetical protein
MAVVASATYLSTVQAEVWSVVPPPSFLLNTDTQLAIHKMVVVDSVHDFVVNHVRCFTTATTNGNNGQCCAPIIADLDGLDWNDESVSGQEHLEMFVCRVEWEVAEQNPNAFRQGLVDLYSLFGAKYAFHSCSLNTLYELQLQGKKL